MLTGMLAAIACETSKAEILSRRLGISEISGARFEIQLHFWTCITDENFFFDALMP
jgi:hypothetical protein